MKVGDSKVGDWIAGCLTRLRSPLRVVMRVWVTLAFQRLT